MVRLVFRPYTQVWRSICTSESLRASTRVSPGFALPRHSSPSFGSQHICSDAAREPWPTDRSMVPRRSHLGRPKANLYFHYAQRFYTGVLAHMSDSLVRVSRRADWTHFVSIFDARSCLAHRGRSEQARGRLTGSPVAVGTSLPSAAAAPRSLGYNTRLPAEAGPRHLPKGALTQQQPMLTGQLRCTQLRGRTGANHFHFSNFKLF